jgi:pyruvate/2-oxoglutarate dehydrogenase complex dihydrolipoamide acyltransferase (E2) component
MTDTMLEKIRKILAQAEGTDNEHEADAFLKKAQKLAHQHAIDLEKVRQSSTGQRTLPERRIVHIGERGKQGNALLVSLVWAIGKANDVTVEAASNSTYAVLYGFPSDIEVVETIYTHLSLQMVQAATDYLKTGVYKNEFNQNTWKPIDGRTARKSFYQAFVARIHKRLTEANQEAEQETADTGTSTALVLVKKRDEVEKFREGTSQAKGSWRGPRNTGNHSRHAQRAGDEAGRKARLSAQSSLNTNGGSKEVTR